MGTALLCRFQIKYGALFGSTGNSAAELNQVEREKKADLQLVRFDLTVRWPGGFTILLLILAEVPGYKNFHRYEYFHSKMEAANGQNAAGDSSDSDILQGGAEDIEDEQVVYPLPLRKPFRTEFNNLIFENGLLAGYLEGV